MATTVDYPLQRKIENPEFSFSEVLYKWVATVDHKRLGLMYIATALLFFVIAGLMAAVIRLQLAFPNGHVVDPDTYNRLFTMHGTTMVFLVGMPMVAGFSNYLVPLMIGARDMAFPRLNSFGYWIFLFGGFLLYFSYIGGNGLAGAGSAPDIGWFAYSPLDRQGFLARRLHGLLDTRHSGLRRRQHRQRAERHRYLHLHALPRHDVSAGCPCSSGSC